jgi:hypothetical protein
MKPPLLNALRPTAVAVAVLTACFWMAGCLAHAPQRSSHRLTRDDDPADRPVVVRPERRVTQARRDERRRAAQPWLSDW